MYPYRLLQKHGAMPLSHTGRDGDRSDRAKIILQSGSLLCNLFLDILNLELPWDIQTSYDNTPNHG